MDSLSNDNGSGARVISEGLNGMVLEYSLKFGFKAMNNQAKCEALVAGL